MVQQKFLTDHLQDLRQKDLCQHRYSKMIYRVCYIIRTQCITADETMRCFMPLPQVKHAYERFSKKLSIIINCIENIDQLPALPEEYTKKNDIASGQTFHSGRGSFIPCTIGVDAMAVESSEEKASKIVMNTRKAN
jgi:hypothetical protein